MQIKILCTLCDASGQKVDPLTIPPTSGICQNCDGVGYTTIDVIAPELDTIFEKLEEIKTKQNQMQADINYIKAKVG